MKEHDKRLLWRCEHRHNGYEHVKCYDRFHASEQKIGFLDIETEDLRADYGIIFGYCIKVRHL